MRRLLHILIVAGALALGPLPALAQESSPAEPSTDAPLLPLDQAAESVPSDPAAASSMDQAPEVLSPEPMTESETPMPDSAAVPADSAPSMPDTIQEALPIGQPAGDPFATGLSAYQKQDFTTAIQNFESVVQSNPQSADAYFYLGYSLYKLKRFDESRLVFTRLYALQSNYRPPLPASK